MSKSKSTKRDRPDIAIVGMSALFPKAPGLKDYWKVLRLGVDTITDIPETHWRPEDYFDSDKSAPDKTYCKRGGFLDAYPFDPTEFSLPPTVLEATDTSQLLGLVAAKAALEDAGYGPDREFKRDQTSIILGVTGTLELVVPLGARLGHPMWKRALRESGLEEELVDEVMSRIAADYVPWQENSFPGLLGNVVAGRIANRLDLHGTNCVVDAACASTLSATHLAFMELETGKADMVITGGVDTFNDIFMYMCFSKTPALSPSGKIRPFDAESDGTLIGEGLGMVVFKRLEDAERDGDRVYAVVKGVGTSSDGKERAVYAPYSPGQARALRRAYENAGVSARTVELVEAHGTGTKVGDVVEFEALKAVFAEVSDDHQWCALGSVKSQIGHTKAAAGSAGLIKAALALHHKVLPPTINIKEPNPKLGMENSAFYLNTKARPWPSNPDHPRRAGLSSFGFGGSNFHIVLEEYGAERTEPAWDGSVELAAFSADSVEGLISAVQAALNDERPLSAPLWEARQKFDSKAAHRLVVPAVADQMHEELTSALKALRSGGKLEFYGTGKADGKLGYVFPGQGSQYVNMGVDLACVFPEMLRPLEEAGREISQAIYPRPGFAKEIESEQQAYLTATDRAQPALGVIERGYFHLLERFGLKPEATAGHSYGELAALYAAGVIDAEGLVTLSGERGRLMAGQGDDLGTMMAVKGSLDEVERVLAESGTKVVLANKNSREQCVLSGSAEDLEALLPHLKKAKLRGIPLKVGAAFHSSFVAGAQEPFLKVANSVKFRKSDIPVYANKTAALYPKSAKASRALLAEQLVSQVNWVDLIEAMYADGVRTFVEVGPKTVLSGLVKSILGDREIKVVSLDRSAGRKSSLLDFATSLAELAVHGLPVTLKEWETEPKAERKRRMTIPICGANYRSTVAKKPEVRPAGSIGKATRAAAPQPIPAAAAPVARKVTETLPVRNNPRTTPVVAAAPQPPVSTPSIPAAPAPAQSHSLNALLPHLEALQELSRQTAQVHQQFLKSQEAAQNALGQLLSPGVGQTAAAQPSSMAPAAYQAAPPVASQAAYQAPAPVAPARPAATPAAPVARTAPAARPAPRVQPAAAPARPAARAPVAAAAPVAKAPAAPKAMGGTRVADALLAVVTDKTGYPLEMLSLDMDLESDLGIDSIKRVEILAAVEEAVPELPKIDAEVLGSLRTLGEIVEAMSAGALSQEAAPSSAPVAVDSGVANALLAVVSEKTGYPLDMLELDMDLESDLGIDSIKRVEILAAMEEAVPGLPKVDAERLGSLHTLGEIVGAMTPAGAAAPVASAAAPVADGRVSEAMFEVVTEKTGYPRDMLTLDMDLESDLGIDSIKRVEILAAIEEAVPGLPKVDADLLGSLRTLGEIVEAMTPAGSVAAAPAPVASGQTDDVTNALLAVVTEKTGYPLDMLTLDMDLESDLGIDSIKRVEILAAVEEALPHLPRVDAESLGSLRTLGEIVTAMVPAGGAPAAAPAAPASGGQASDVTDALLAVVTEKTGYPLDMLTLDMDLESDLGIDSIKRVEILAAVEEALPHLPRVDADSLGSLRTLGEIVTAMVPSGAAASAPSAPAVCAPTTCAEEPAAAGTISRQTLQLVDIGPGQATGLPLPEDKRIAIIEDTPGIGKELAKILQARGVEVSTVSSADALPEDLGILLLVGNGGDQKRSREFLIDAFKKTREAGPLLKGCRGALFTVTGMDGAFGLKGNDFDPFVGGLAGIPKTVAHEWPEVFCRAIDHAADVAVEQLADELMKDGPVEVALSKGLRQTISTVAAQTTVGDSYLSSKDVVLVTGGARGVTAACVTALAERYKPSFVLLGRTPLEDDSFDLYPGIDDDATLKRAILDKEFKGKATPRDLESSARRVLAQREIRQTLATIEAAGAKGLYLSGDVRDRDQLKKHLKTVEKKFGKVTSLIHGAGVLADRKIEEKTDEQFQQVFSTKIDSLVLLMELLPDLRSMVFFSSVTARFGRPGQIDYCMANEVLNKFAQVESRRRPRCKVVAMGWGPWAGGMVTPALAREFQRIGVGLIPLEEGANAVVEEFIHHGSVQAEVLFGDGFPEPPGGGQTSSKVSIHKGDLLLEKTLSVEALPFLKSHQIDGRPVLPMAFMQEWFVQGALQFGAGLRLVEVRDLKVFRGAIVEPGVEPTLGVTSTKQETVANGDQLFTLELRDVSRNVLHARAVVVLGDQAPSAPAVGNIDELKSERYAHSPEDIYSQLLFHGHDFHAVNKIDGISDSGLVAELKIASKPADWERNPLRSEWATEPLAVDGVLQLGILWGWEKLSKPSLPNGFAHYRQYVRRFPRDVVKAALRVTNYTERKVVADCDLIDVKGNIVARFEDLEWTADDSLKSAFGRTGALAARG